MIDENLVKQIEKEDHLKFCRSIDFYLSEIQRRHAENTGDEVMRIKAVHASAVASEASMRHSRRASFLRTIFNRNQSRRRGR